MKARLNTKQIESALRAHALSYPETREDFPWGERALKVKGKVFVFMGSERGQVTISVKLPRSGELARDFPFAEPTHYGLGKHGWITVHIKPGPVPPLDLLRAWIDESFRAVAPKKLVQELESRRSPTPGKKARGRSITMRSRS